MMFFTFFFTISLLLKPPKTKLKIYIIRKTFKTWWEHKVEVVSDVLIEVGHHVVVVAEVEVDLVVVVVVSVHIIVDVQY